MKKRDVLFEQPEVQKVYDRKSHLADLEKSPPDGDRDDLGENSPAKELSTTSRPRRPQLHHLIGEVQ